MVYQVYTQQFPRMLCGKFQIFPRHSQPPGMAVPHITMQTEGKHSFSPQDGYDDVTTADLQELLRLGRETVLSLEDELARRNTSASNTLPSAVKACLEKLQSTMYTLGVVQRLEDPSSLASAAAEILRTEQQNRKDKVYKQFLGDAQQQCGGGVGKAMSSESRSMICDTGSSTVKRAKVLRSSSDPISGVQPLPILLRYAER